MRDAIKNVFLMGIGAATITRRKAEETIKVFVKNGTINRKQANELVARVMRESKRIQNKLKREGSKEIARVKRNVITTGKKVTKEVGSKIKTVRRKIIKKGMKL